MSSEEVQDIKKAFDSSLGLSRLLLNIYGFWPYDIISYEQADTTKKKFFWALRRFVLFCNAIFISSETLYIFLVAKGSVIPTVECIITFVAIIFYTAVTCILFYQRDKIIYIIDTLRSYTEIQDKANFAMFKTNSPKLRLLAYVLYIVTGVCMFVYIGIPMWLAYKAQMNNKDEVIKRPLPFHMWYPYEVNEDPYYQISFVLESFRGIGMLNMITGYDSLFAVIMVYTCGQYYVLKSKFQNIFEQARENLKNKQYTLNNNDQNIKQLTDEHFEKMMDEEVNYLLKKNIEHHIALNDLCDKQEHIFSLTVFLHLSLHAFILCSVVYLMLISINNGDYWNFVKYTTFKMLLIIELFMYGYFGTMLIEASTSLTDGCFHSEWYETSSKEFKSSLHIVLHRSQKPCVLTGLKFSVLSLEIVLSILSSSYSYFTLLNTAN